MTLTQTVDSGTRNSSRGESKMTDLANIELVLGDEEVFGVYEGDLFIADSNYKAAAYFDLATRKSMQLPLKSYGVYLKMMKATRHYLNLLCRKYCFILFSQNIFFTLCFVADFRQP